MHSLSQRLTLLVPLLLAAVPSQTQPAPGGFTLYPVQVNLSPRATSALLTLRNESNQELRFQLSAFAWEQSRQGEMQVAPTRDIVFFPPLLTVPPRGERKVRVGAATPFAPTEKTYRLFVEQLPPLERRHAEARGQVRVRMKMGIPIFLQPPNPVAKGQVEAMSAAQGHFSFQVRNLGNVHFQAQKLQVKGLGTTGESVWQWEATGWYILAGGARVYDLQLPPGECPQIKTLAIQIKTERETLAGTFATPAGGCGKLTT